MHQKTADRYLYESIEDLKMTIVLLENRSRTDVRDSESMTKRKTHDKSYIQSLKSVSRRLQAVQDGIENGLSIADDDLEIFEL